MFGDCSVHVMAGLAGDVPREMALQTYVANLGYAARQAENTRIRLLIEPLNHFDRPGYLLSSPGQAAGIIDGTGLHDLRIMFDCYHVEREEGDLVRHMREVWPKIGHIQFAGVPARGVPTEGCVDYAAVFAEIDRLGWTGWVGAEYRVAETTPASLAWLEAYRTMQA